MSEAPQKVARSEWEYRLLIRMPEYVTESEAQKGVQAAFTKKKVELLKEVEFYTMKEGKSVQMLHVGPFVTERETLQQMHAFIQANGFSQNGLHHEIYLSNFNKIAPHKLKTILREPVL